MFIDCCFTWDDQTENEEYPLVSSVVFPPKHLWIQDYQPQRTYRLIWTTQGGKDTMYANVTCQKPNIVQRYCWLNSLLELVQHSFRHWTYRTLRHFCTRYTYHQCFDVPSDKCTISQDKMLYRLSVYLWGKKHKNRNEKKIRSDPNRSEWVYYSWITSLLEVIPLLEDQNRSKWVYYSCIN